MAATKDIRLPVEVVFHPSWWHRHEGILFDRDFLLPFDMRWAERYPPYGIHYCGPDPHRFAAAYREISGLAFLDVGWGGDLVKIRAVLPQAFLNIRLNPAEIVRQTPAEIERAIAGLIRASADPRKTGICCINIDDTASEEQITAIFETVGKIRRSSGGETS